MYVTFHSEDVRCFPTAGALLPVELQVNYVHGIVNAQATAALQYVLAHVYAPFLQSSLSWVPTACLDLSLCLGNVYVNISFIPLNTCNLSIYFTWANYNIWKVAVNQFSNVLPSSEFTYGCIR